MRVYVDTVAPDHWLAPAVRRLAEHGVRHRLADGPEDAELIILCGPFSRHPQWLTAHPLVTRFADRCAVYTEDDSYLPLMPGVYTSPRRGLSTRIGRVRSYAFAASYGTHANLAVTRAATQWRPGSGPGKALLCSFEGTRSSRLRRLMFRLELDPAEVLITDTSRLYTHFDQSAAERPAGQQRYVENMLRSRFVLCPRGVGTGTLRLFEAMSLGVAPVLLSDNYVLPSGPDWDDFLVRVDERAVRRFVPVLRTQSATSDERGQRARQAWDLWFSPAVFFDTLVDAADDARKRGARFQAAFRLARPLQVLYFRANQSLRNWLWQSWGRLLTRTRAVRRSLNRR